MTRVVAVPAPSTALERQVVAPDAVIGYDQFVTGIGDEFDWVWLLDGSAVPALDALAQLLEAEAAATTLRPALLASTVVDNRGEHSAPWYRRRATAQALEAFAHRLLPIRAAPGASLLVRRDAVARIGPPLARIPTQVRYLEWTGRLLREHAGYLVPASVVVGKLHDELAPRTLLPLLRSPAWSWAERAAIVLDSFQRREWVAGSHSRL